MNLTLLTDLYELTMLAGYFELRKTKERATFDLYFRKIPSQGGYCIAAGLEDAIKYVQNLRFTKKDIGYLRSLELFSEDFLKYLKDFHFTGDIYAVPEGSLIFPNEPLIRVAAPLLEAQFLETALLNLVGYPTLVATKANRICLAADGREVIEFGARRAQGPNGALCGARAAFIGGCASTSNVLAGREYGIPVRGTMAHSWIQSFDSEIEAFMNYAEIFPKSTLLLVDTYETIEGVKKAIRVGLSLKKLGLQLSGIRLDSGDIKKLSIEARRLLDEAGLSEVKIVASNELDEWIVKDLIAQGARVDIFGVGTHLITSKDVPSLGVVYKLVAIEKEGRVLPKIKISSNVEKMTNPGIKKIVRVLGENGKLAGDFLALEEEKISLPITTFDQVFPYKKKALRGAFREVLEPIFLEGEFVYKPPFLPEIQKTMFSQVDMLEPEYKRLLNPEYYWVGLTEQLSQLKQKLILEH
ncbi:MAG: nicotinate phosphoribosyltransferase [Candidatus Nealsonbacteria bacterium]|nr:nicotinate phosphoribosyltransferase [Candidatus Nealsonbacteria bacterium]